MSKRPRPPELLARVVVTSGTTAVFTQNVLSVEPRLQATVPFYLSEVQVDRDGFIVNYAPAYEDTKDCINLEEPELTEIYCANDHSFVPPTSRKARPRKQSKRSTKQARKK